jgi:FkbM family methyltransferase
VKRREAVWAIRGCESSSISLSDVQKFPHLAFTQTVLWHFGRRALFRIASILPQLSRLKIIDVGASLSPDAPAYAKLLETFPSQIIGFEADTAECEKLNRMNTAGHVFLPYAVGDGSPRTFYECTSPYCSSLFEPDIALADKFQNLADLLAVVGKREVQTKRLDDIAETQGADFLKVDVQGGELLVLEGAVERLSTALAVHIEVEFLPLYKNQPLFADIDGFLRRRGFAFHTLIPSGRTFKPVTVNNNPSGWIRQIVWADAVYVADFMTFEGRTPEALLKLAAIPHESYQSVDLAALALEAYDKRTNSHLQPAYLRQLAGP